MHPSDLSDMTDEEIQQMKIELKEMFKELIATQLAIWINDLNKTRASKDELQKISKRHKRGKR